LEKRHVDEITLCQSSRAGEELTTSSRQQLEFLHSQLQESSDAREKLVNEMAELKQSCLLEVESFKQKIAVLQEQVEGAVKEKQIYEQHILESRDKLEKDLTTYKQQVENLNFQLQEASKAETNYSQQLYECKKVYEADLSSYKQSHEMELTLYKEQVDSLNLQLQEALKGEAEFSSKLVECKKACEAELASYQQSHEMELASYKQSAEALKLLLQEASVAEENFPKVLAAHKQSLELEVCRYKEENEALNTELKRILSSEEMLRKEKAEMLASHNAVVSSYEEQLAALKESLQAAEETVTCHERELSSLKKQLKDNSDATEDYVKVMSYKEQIVTLSTQLEEALKYGEKCKQDFAVCKKSHEEEINLVKQNLEPEQIERNAIAKYQSHEAELALCKQQIEFLNSRLKDASEAEKCHVSEITACQTQLKEYKEQVDFLDRRFSEELVHAQEDFSKEINSKGQEIETLLARLQEASALEEKHQSHILSAQQEIEDLNVQLQENAETEKINIMEIASYQEKLTAYGDQVQAFKRMAASQDELDAYKQQVKTLKESLHYELSSLQDSHNAQLRRIEEEHAVQIASLSNQVDDLTLQLGEVTKANEILEREKSTYQNLHAIEIDKYKHQLEEFSAQLQESRKNEGKYVADMSDCQKQLITYKNQVQMLTAKIQDDMSQVKVLHIKEVNDLRDELRHLKNIKATLEAEVLCLNETVKHRDDSSRAQLEEVTVQFLKTQSLLAAKEELEEAFEARISDLQIELEKANQSIEHMQRENEQLQEMTVQYLKLEGLLAAKEEAEHMLSEHVQELEEALCIVKNDSEQMNHDSCESTLKVAKAKELFKKMKYERDELLAKCKQFEAEREQLVSEKKMTEEKLKDLASQVHKLKTNSVGENVVASGSSDLSPVADMCAGVIVTPLECASVNDSSVSSGQAVVTVSGFDSTQVVNYSEDIGQISDSGPLKRRKTSTTNVPEPVSSFCSSKLIEKLIVFEREKMELANKLETLESKFQEKVLQECLCNEESSVAKIHCKELEEKLLQLEKIRIERDIILQEKNDLELKVVDLERENTTFRNLQSALSIELTEEKMANEDKLHQVVTERLENIIDDKNSATIENVILDLGNKAKEIVFLKEKLRSQEQTCQLLNEKILIFEKSKAEDAKKIDLCHEELAGVRSELEESWKEHNATKEELGTSKKELTILYMQKEQYESSRNRLLQRSTSHAEGTPICGESLHLVTSVEL
jgi:chromosome segregation ATPase